KRFSHRERMALMELYGRPHRWVEAADGDNPGRTEDLEAAKEAADDMGADTVGGIPAGWKLMMQQVAAGANEIHKEVFDDCNNELSKLVLGSTNTTDAQPGGLGSGQAYVHKSGEDLVFATDC